MALGFRDGQLVRYSPDVDVVKAIEDPTGSGATESAAVEVEFRGTRFRVALASGFGWLADEVDEGEAATLEQWFAEQHALPSNDCGVQTQRNDVSRADLPEPDECWVELDSDGDLVARGGATIERQVYARPAAGALPPGVHATGVAFRRNGTEWFGVVRAIGDGAFVSTTLARVTDLPEGTTLEGWADRVASETSASGHPAGAHPEPTDSLTWWDPKTGAFAVPDGVTLVRRIDNPMELTAPADSAGLVFDLDGERYWALTEISAPRSDGTYDDIRHAGGVTIRQAHGIRGAADFEAWLDTQVTERLSWDRP
jgi:hypothetical protein